MYRFDGSTVLAIKTDVTHTVTHQTTHILPPAGTQNALGESHKKASTQQATRRTGVLARCRRAHCARFGRWRSQKHRRWPSAGVSGGGRDLTLRADDPTSRGTTQPPTNPTQHQTTPLKARSPVGPSNLRSRPCATCLLVHSTIYLHMASMGDASGPMPAIQDMRARGFAATLNSREVV